MLEMLVLRKQGLAAIGTNGKLNVGQFMETVATQGVDTLPVGAGPISLDPLTAII